MPIVKESNICVVNQGPSNLSEIEQYYGCTLNLSMRTLAAILVHSQVGGNPGGKPGSLSSIMSNKAEVTIALWIVGGGYRSTTCTVGACLN